jgi:2-oxoglutarate/2-oxoacid ferredoxin oxidoreductase subunit beta
MTLAPPPASLKPKDFASAEDVRWCPGCGNYSVIKAVQKVLADSSADPAATAFISGIGCSSRFPYYMETYGFHTIHGRAAAVATGVTLANPALDVWVVSGDGDSLAIGGNHLLHVVRRNVDLTYLLLNNEIYGLTKGQMSPTSRRGTRSPTSPNGVRDEPVHPARFVLGSGGRFIARTVDTAQAHMVETIARARAFAGTGFVEILQNCLVFNDGVFEPFEDKKQAPEKLLYLKHGEAMLFGAARDRGLVLDPVTLDLSVARVGGADGVPVERVLVHDETNRRLALLLAELDGGDLPLPVGVIYAAPTAAYEEVHPAPAHDPAVLHAALEKAMRAGQTWRVD